MHYVIIRREGEYKYVVAIGQTEQQALDRAYYKIGNDFGFNLGICSTKLGAKFEKLRLIRKYKRALRDREKLGIIEMGEF